MATFLDALSVFAVVALAGLLGLAVATVQRERSRQEKALRRAEAGLSCLVEAARDIRGATNKFSTGGRDVEMFLLALLFRAGTLDEDRLHTVAARLLSASGDAAGTLDAKSFAAGVLQLAAGHEPESSAQSLAEARALLGPTPVAALEQVIAGQTKTAYPFGTAAHVTGFLLRCDLVDRAVAASPTREAIAGAQ